MRPPAKPLRPEDYPDVPVHLVRDFERARLELAGVYPPLRYAYVTGRAQGMRHADAVRYVERLAAVRRRWDRDRKECERCGHDVLWRRERGRSLPINRNGTAHACL